MSQLSQVSVSEAPIGGLGVSPNANVSLSGIAATGTLGNSTIVAVGNFFPTGLGATTAVGQVEAASQFIATVTGIEMVASLDEDTKAFASIVIEEDASFLSTMSLGTASATGGASASPAGIEITSALGSPSVTGTGSVSLTGEAATGSVGDVTIDLLLVVPVTGQAGTSSLGSAEFQGDVSVAVTGLSMTAEQNSVSVWGKIVPNQSPNWTEIAA